MRKKVFVIFLVALFAVSLVAAQELTGESDQPVASDDKVQEAYQGLSQQLKSDNPWNETVVVSDAWQTVLDGLFGLNLQDNSLKEGEYITVREAIVLFALFVMVFIVLWDVAKFVPYFDKKILGVINTPPFIALILTFILSMIGSFNGLKDVLLQFVVSVAASLDWTWLNWLVENKTWGIIISIFGVIIPTIILHEAIFWLGLKFRKKDLVTKARLGASLIGQQRKLQAHEQQTQREDRLTDEEEQFDAFLDRTS